MDAFVEKVSKKLGYPVFVKPTDGGSSFGISKVKSREKLAEAVNYAFSEGPTVIVEKAVVGREVTCAAYFDGKDVATLPLIEIVTDNEYFDYDAKYNGNSREICPAPLDADTTAHVQDVTRRIYRHMGCKGLVRMDYILSDEGLYFLEINTIPGMTNASLVPKMVQTAGMDMTTFLTILIENS